MRIHSLGLVFVLCVAWSAAGCKKSSGDQGSDAAAADGGNDQGGSGAAGSQQGQAGKGGSGSTAGSGDIDAGLGNGDGGTGTNTTQPKSNTPNAIFKETSEERLGVELVSSNLLYTKLGSTLYRRWYAELNNASNKLVCLIEIKPTLKDGQGNVLAKMDGFVDAAPYKSKVTSDPMSLPCIAPGKHGAVWTVDTVTESVNPADVATFDFEVIGLNYTTTQAVPNPLAPEITSQSVTDPNSDGTYALTGDITAKAGAVNDVMLFVYPVVGGLIVDYVSAMRAGALSKGAVWSYQTDTTSTVFTKYLVFTAFTE
jgi:hypothetical protein